MLFNNISNVWLVIVLLVVSRITDLVAQDIRSLEMSIMIGWKFQCANTTCLPIVTASASDIRNCQIACLAQVQCKAASFQQSASSCKLFSNISNQNSNMSADMATVSMVVMSRTRIPSVTTTSVVDDASLWSFNNNTLDSLSGFNGVGVNSPTYKTPGIDGYGSALSVNGGSGQYVNIPAFRNLTYRSFTIELWFYCTTLTNSDYGLFGQHYASTIDQSLHFIIRTFRLYFAFFLDDLSGSAIIQTNIWYHVALVYDYPSLTQKIYLNGKLEGSRSSNPYRGMGGAIVIGKTEQIIGTPDYFSGYIDEVSLVMRTKNSTEILDDATLVTWNTFDRIPYYDSGPLRLSVTTANLTSVSGRVNQAISFTSSLSYYQIGGFVLLGVSSYSFSIALWVRPLLTNGSILVRLSTATNGSGWCVDYIGFSATGQITATVWNGTGVQVIGPILSANSWTHVVQTYSSADGLRLYVNATLIGVTGAMSTINSGAVDIITLGNFIRGNQSSTGGSCTSQSIFSKAYYGYIDEFRVYSRELNSADIYTLANP